MTAANLNPSGNRPALERIRIRIVQSIAILSIVLAIGVGIPYRVLLFVNQETPTNALNFGIAVALVLLVLWVVLSFVDYPTVAAYGLVATYILLTAMPLPISQVLPIITTVITATMIYDWRAFVMYLTVLVLVVAQKTVNLPADNPEVFIVEQIYVLAGMGIAAVAIRFFQNSIRLMLDEAERTSDLLRIGSEVGQLTVGMVSLEELLSNAVLFIRDRFAFYHVQIFLLDDTEQVALLRASTGEAGRKLLERGHRLSVGSNSVIGRVTASGEPAIAQDTDQGDGHYRNELLPNTRSELALPIKDGGKVIGALDVQSTRPNAFGTIDVQALQIMTNLLATAIQNARLFDEQQVNVRENQRLYIQSEANLREIQRLNRQLTQESWYHYVTDLGTRTSVAVEGNRVSNTESEAWSVIAQQSVQLRQAVVDEREDGHLTLAVPILLRGEVIGVVELEPDSENLDPDDMVEIVRAASERLAISLDNARLFEESQETTQYEQRINAIVEQYQQADTIDDLLQITLSELTETLGADYSAIRLTTRQDTEAYSGSESV